jgi:hypothetical protein
MRWFGPLALLVSAIPGPGAYSVLAGVVGFSASGEWGEIARVDGDSTSVVGFVLPRRGGDSTATAANVIVDISLHHGRVNVKAFGDMRITQIAAGPGAPQIVTDSSSSEDSSRTIVWSSELRGARYIIRDKLLVRDSIYIDIRAAIPTSYASDSAWQRRYRAALDTLLHSTCVSGHPVIPPNGIPCANIDRVLPFSREENGDGARFVWFISRQAGFSYPYIACAGIPSSPSFREVPADSVRAGDVAWWPSYVALYDPVTRMLRRPEGAVLLVDWMLNLGPAKFYRRQVGR